MIAGQENTPLPFDPTPHITSISALTLATHDMMSAVQFYRALGFAVRYGGENASFTSFHAGSGYLNLIAQPQSRRWSWWGRVVFHVSDVDAIYVRAKAQGLSPEAPPVTPNGGSDTFTSAIRMAMN